MQVDKEDRGGEHSARETRVQRLHCEANKGESLAQIHIYSARNVPMSPDHMATFCTVYPAVCVIDTTCVCILLHVSSRI